LELSRPVERIRVTIYRITLPVSIADKLGGSVKLQYSDSDKSLTVRRSSNGEFKIRQVGKVRSTRSINCKGFVIVNNIPKGTYPGYWDEDGKMLIVKLSKDSAE
jgi:hypothetical protein